MSKKNSSALWHYLNDKPIVAPLAVIYLLFTLVFAINYLSHPLTIIASDLVSFLTGATMIWEGQGKFLYDLSQQLTYQMNVISPLSKGNLLPFRGLPLTALFFIPLTFLTLKTAYYFVLLLNVILIFVLARKLIKKFSLEKLGLLATIFTLIYWSSVSSLLLGQYTPVVALMVLFIYSAFKIRKHFVAGLLSGLLLIKPQMILITPFLFFYSEKKVGFLKGFLLSTSVFLTASLLISGQQALMSYFSFLGQTENPFYGSRPYHMFSLYSSLKILFPSLWETTLHFVNIFAYFSSLVVLLKKKINFDDFFLLAVILTLVFSTHALVHDLMILLIPLAILLKKFLDHPTNNLKITIVVLYMLPLAIFTGNTFYTSFALLGVAAYYLRFTESKPRLRSGT